MWKLDDKWGRRRKGEWGEGLWANILSPTSYHRNWNGLWKLSLHSVFTLITVVMTRTISLVANIFNFCVLKFTVAVQLSRKTGGTPHSEIFWQFLHHCLDAFPECFVSLEPQNTNDGILAIGTSSSQGNKICKSGKGKQKFKDFIINSYLISFTNPSLIKL